MREAQYDNRCTTSRRWCRARARRRRRPAWTATVPSSRRSTRRRVQRRSRMARRRRRGGVDLLHERFRRTRRTSARRPSSCGASSPTPTCRSRPSCCPRSASTSASSTTVLNAYVGPKLRRYLDGWSTGSPRRLPRRAADHAVERRRDLAGGGARQAALTAAVGARRRARGAAFFVAGARADRCITIDMGGTSFECLGRVGTPRPSTTASSARPRSRCRCSTSTPSARAAARSPGSTRAACCVSARRARAPTRARLLRPRRQRADVDRRQPRARLPRPGLFRSAGSMRLDPAAARRAIGDAYRRAARASPSSEAAAGIYRIACNNMAQGMREVTDQARLRPARIRAHRRRRRRARSTPPICSELEIPLLIVPREASVLCAFGMLLSELRTTSCAPS